MWAPGWWLIGLSIQLLILSQVMILRVMELGPPSVSMLCGEFFVYSLPLHLLLSPEINKYLKKNKKQNNLSMLEYQKGIKRTLNVFLIHILPTTRCSFLWHAKSCPCPE